MTRIAVLIGTTAGPVQIDRITHETIPQSIVCLQRSSTVLPISNDYHDFVSHGSGVIARDFNLPLELVFRLDLNGSVNTGRSWQLAAYVAHAIDLNQDHILCSSDEVPEKIIWLTGEVDYDGRVIPVAHIPEKLQSLQKSMDRLVDTNAIINLILPRQEDTFAMPSSLLREKVVCLQADDINQVIQFLAISSSSKALTGGTSHLPAHPNSQGSQKRTKAKSLKVLIGMGVFLAGSATAYTIYSKKTSYEVPSRLIENAVLKPTSPKEDHTVVSSAMRVEVFELRSRPGDTCALVHFGRTKPLKNSLIASKEGVLPDSNLNGLCGLAFDVTVESFPRTVNLKMDVQSGSYLDPKGLPPELSGSIPFDGTRTWTINLPRRLSSALKYALTITADAREVNQKVSAGRSESTFSDKNSEVVLHHTILP